MKYTVTCDEKTTAQLASLFEAHANPSSVHFSRELAAQISAASDEIDGKLGLDPYGQRATPQSAAPKLIDHELNLWNLVIDPISVMYTISEDDRRVTLHDYRLSRPF
ncbi:MAG: hypothetical protein K8R36_23140 [Planctomycetales bacterium]|nr:hypothetical protein [Planctomycetales bacterium]